MKTLPRSCAGVAGDEQDVGVAVGRAAIVGEGDPALHVHPPGGLVEQGDIIGLPGKAGGEVGQGQRPRSAGLALHRYRQGRASAQILRHAVEDHPDRQAVVAQHLDPLADLQHDAAIGGEHPRPLAGLLPVRRIGPYQGDRLADRFLHQCLRRQQVEIEILLDDADVGAGQGDRLGADLRGDVGEFLPRAAGGDIELPGVLNQREIVVVDGDGDIALRALRRRRNLVLGRRRRGQEGKKQKPGTHEKTLPRNIVRRSVLQCGQYVNHYRGSGGGRDILAVVARTAGTAARSARLLLAFLAAHRADRRRQDVGGDPLVGRAFVIVAEAFRRLVARAAIAAAAELAIAVAAIVAAALGLARFARLPRLAWLARLARFVRFARLDGLGFAGFGRLAVAPLGRVLELLDSSSS